MLEVILLIVGIAYAIRRPMLKNQTAQWYPGVDPEKFAAWHKVELKATDFFLWATWGSFAIKLATIAVISSTGASPETALVVLVIILIGWATGWIIYGIYYARALKLGEAAGILEPPRLGILQRLAGTLLSPGETFTEIGRAPRVLVPIFCLILLGAATRSVVVNRFGYENMMRKQIEMQTEMMTKMGAPEESVKQAKERAEEQLKPEQARRGKLMDGIIAGLAFPIIVLIVAGVFKLFTLIMGASNTFKGVLSAVSFAFLGVGILHFVVIVISVYLKSPEDIDVLNPVASNVGAILTMAGAGLPKLLTALCSWIDVFGIWRIALLAIGCAAVTTKMKSGTAAIPHVLLYGIAALISSFFASFMS